MNTSLTQQQKNIINLTLPVVDSKLLEITTKFYDLLFLNHPELKNIFNMTNQSKGEQKEALAKAVFVFAKYHENIQRIDPLIKRIANKHVSLGITPQMYNIVATNLIAAIIEILGEAVTVEVANAWAAIYWLFAQTLIKAEADIYSDANVTAATVMRPYMVVDKIIESSMAFTLCFKPVDNLPLPNFLPGQYVSIQVHLPELGYNQLRQYSISNHSQDGTINITLKKHYATNNYPDGLVSLFLDKHSKLGSIWSLSIPVGDFTLDKTFAGPAVMISAGVGITPLMAMLKALVRSKHQQEIQFVHITQNSSTHIFKEELQNLKQQMAFKSLIVYDAPLDTDILGINFDYAGMFDLNKLEALKICPDSIYFLCGPEQFMLEQRQKLLQHNIKDAQIKFEVFGPDLITNTRVHCD